MIRTEACNRCLVCGSEGIRVHDSVPDLMHGTAGRWTIVRCRSTDCGLLWLNPRPAPQDLAQLYEAYFTHDAARPVNDDGGLKDQVRRAIQRRLLGYPAQVSAPVRALAAVVSLVPWYRASALREVFWLPAREKGLLLDVGCGNGQPLQRFAQAGWTAVGIDTDVEAVAAARGFGLDARAGSLKAQNFPDQHFDLILMSHVIEHVADPVDELNECRRVLKRSGSLVIATPNARGLGHRVFGRHWLGLETPRHLQVFTPRALTRLLAMSGFRPERVRTDAVAAANWMVASRWRRDAEVAGRPAPLPTASTRVPLGLLALARIESVGTALGASWGDELIGRYRPA